MRHTNRKMLLNVSHQQKYTVRWPKRVFQNKLFLQEPNLKSTINPCYKRDIV